MSARDLIVGALYAGGLASAAAFFAYLWLPGWALSTALILGAGGVYLRGEQLNARECERRRRTGWRLESDITRLERELGIEGDA